MCGYPRASDIGLRSDVVAIPATDDDGAKFALPIDAIGAGAVPVVRRARWPLLVLAMLVVVTAGGYAWYRYYPIGLTPIQSTAARLQESNQPDRPAQAQAQAQAQASGPTAIEGSMIAHGISIAGNYMATVGDQDIALTLNVDDAKPPEASSGVVHYRNNTVHRECSAMIAPIAGDQNAQGQAFNQASIAGISACDRNIRLRLRAIGDGARLAAVWTDPITGLELMHAQLVR